MERSNAMPLPARRAGAAQPRAAAGPGLRRIAGALLTMLVLGLFSGLGGFADVRAADDGAAAASNPAEAAWEAAAAALQRGPQSIALRDQAHLALPEGYGFVPVKEATTLMEALGNSVSEQFIGLIFPVGNDDAQWLMSVDFAAAGYIKDDDAKHWKADELLQNLKDGTKANNERREKLGYPPIEVTRWVEPPAYDAVTQRLVWSAEARDIGAQPGSDATVNYNTYVLGREGYISMNLITSASKVEDEKPAARTLLSAVSFDDGKRYADFNASTDKVAEYGLAALVGGIAAKKLGLLALAGAFFAKFAKIIVLALAGAAALFRKVFAGRKA